MTQKNLTLTLSKSDYDSLLDLVSIATFVIDELKETHEHLDEKYVPLVRDLLAHASKIGLANKTTYESGKLVFSSEMGHNILQQFIYPYNEQRFWLQLEEDLARRDAKNAAELTVFATQSETDKQARYEATFNTALKKYTRELVEYRLQRLVIDKSITPNVRYKTKTITVYSVNEIRAIEQYCYTTLKLEAFTLMTRAGEQAWHTLQKNYPDAKTITVLIGPGNNGGDGYVLACSARKVGLTVNVVTASDTPPPTDVAQKAYQRYCEAGGTIQTYNSNLPECDVLVDALFGIGLDRAITGIYADMINTANQLSTPIVALDCPSGLNADTGKPFADTIKAAHTYTFIEMKQGLLSNEAKAFVGQWKVCHLGLSNEDILNALKSED